MSRIRMAVEIHNETTLPLTLDQGQGDWTDPWQPPTTIDPGKTGEFRAEGDAILEVPSTGTEGSVHYNLAGDEGRQLYVHWNSPLIESQYANTFHVWAPQQFQADHSGGQGHDARLVVRLRHTARRRVAGFLPSVCAWQFGNYWSPDLPVVTIGHLWNRLLADLGGDVAERLGLTGVADDWLPLTRAESGLCGGMAFATKDYAAVHQLPPAVQTAPTSANDPVFKHIRDRLIDSFDIGGSGYRWLAYSSPAYPNGDEGFIQRVGLARGRSWITYRDEWPRIRADIDAGVLSPIGLIQTDELAVGDNHTVLAYAYEQSGQVVKLWIADSNEPRKDAVTLEFDITDTAGEVHVTRAGGDAEASKRRIFCIIRLDGYNPHAPPDGRPGDAITVRQALARATLSFSGRLPGDAGLARPASVRSWMRSI